MAMFMVKPWYKESGPTTPDECFDPTTHIATEENFIKFLEFGVYNSKYIGYKVQLSNSSGYYNNGIWIIADVNHDSANTGQTNCYDLISEKIFYANTPYTTDWRSFSSRSWLNNNFYNGFSNDFKSHLIKPKYKLNTSWYTDDYIIIPSKKEMNVGTAYAENEGVVYPIFTDNASRKKIRVDSGSYGRWWTRSRHTKSGQTAVWTTDTDGSVAGFAPSTSSYLAPILRIS